MKSIKNKIKIAIKESNGFPGYTRREYLESVRLLLKKKFSSKEIYFIQGQNINLDKWIAEITVEITESLF